MYPYEYEKEYLFINICIVFDCIVGIYGRKLLCANIYCIPQAEQILMHFCLPTATFLPTKYSGKTSEVSSHAELKDYKKYYTFWSFLGI